MNRKVIFGLTILSLWGCQRETMASPSPSMTPLSIEMVETTPLEYDYRDIHLSIHADQSFDQVDTLIQWMDDQQLLASIYTTTWQNTLNGLTIDQPVGVDQRLFSTLEIAQLINSKMDELSPLVLSNTYFNAYDYIHLDPLYHTIKISTPLQFVDIEPLTDALWAYQLIATMPKMDFDDLTITTDGYTIILNNTSNYVTTTFNDSYGWQCLDVNLVHNELVYAMDLTSDDLDRIIWITSDPLILPLLQPYLNDLSFNQIDQLVQTLQQDGHAIHAIYFKDGQATFDPKYSYGDTNVTWTNSLDSQLSPRLN